ncbi:M20/M25/M40 family metallo-hydrolase [Desulfosediminicola ganghwensis]|uniref:M20/M25/M40 family metallo-hydrolase n=1 Tax=Desulfosediminicola ganghwensis TaxID=2569540 RepID=UPI001C3E2EAD|nr:M20/M25/M40 family metallo-hydrolase [Desulfosediminicola ganghwensis]
MRLRFAPQGILQWLATLGCLLLLMVGIMSSFLALIGMPGSSYTGPLQKLSAAESYSTARLAGHVRALAQDIGPRNIWTTGSMADSVRYIHDELAALGYQVEAQEVPSVKGMVVNLEIGIPGRKLASEIVVVGAHYDTVPDCPGANDNASGLAVLLELARLLADCEPQRTIRLVAFANEEAPFFATKSMGSRVYAMQARMRQEKITAMLSLETMGYYSDERESQFYPFPLSYFYPDQANFIAFVSNIKSRRLVRRAISAFRRHGHFPSEGLAAPVCIRGASWSDHQSFWAEGYPAIMVTDTAFYRYAAYHTPHDTPEKLDYERLARVVSGLAATIQELASTNQENMKRIENGVR